MVRINLVKPRALTDQHLIAEYNEILMLFGYFKKYPSVEIIPKKYCLGKGHMKFFKNKLLFLKKRHEAIKKEMRKRGFKAEKSIILKNFNPKCFNDWKPKQSDFDVIKKRLAEKISSKPSYYSYFGKKKSKKDLLALLKN